MPARQRPCPPEQTPPPQFVLLQQFPSKIHDPFQSLNPEKHAQMLPWQTPLPPQLASMRQEPAGRHFVPHLTFGALHSHFLCFFASLP